MLVPVSSDGPLPEWGLVELQGRIEQQLDFDSDENLPVGTLIMSSTQPGLAQLTIGYHQLEGKQVALKKPLAIMEKGVDASCGGCCGYKVIGVVRSKYLFKTRPRALITKPPPRKTE